MSKTKSKTKSKIKSKSRITIHCVTDGQDTKAWVHTHGMSDHGLPELEIRSIPTFLSHEAATILTELGEYLSNTDMTVTLGTHLILWDDVIVSFRQSVPIPGEEDHFKDERWELIDVPVGCLCERCRLRRVWRDRTEGEEWK